MCYPAKLREEICSSIFRNIKRDGMYVKKETVDEHFKIKNLLLVVDDLLKKIGTVCMLRLGILLRKKKLNGDFFVMFLFVYKKKNRMSDNTYGSVILHVEFWYFFLLL